MEYEYELYHFGIKGMKWGVRRFQKKDGSLTPAGKKRYSDSEPKKSNHRKDLEARYMKKGLSRKEAEAAANKRIKIEKTLAITAGVTVAACAAYYAKNKWVADRTDQILKAGTSFHNLDGRANKRPGEALYVNYRQNDRNFFNGKFALNKLKRAGHVYEHRIVATEDIKIPSLNTRKSVFKQLCEKDPAFREAMAKHSHMSSDASPKLLYKTMWPKFGDKDTPYFNEAKAKYFKALQEKGYAAIVDEWDTRKSVYRSDAPLILLNTSHKSLGEMTIREMKAADILTAQANSHAYTFKNNLLNAIDAPHTNHFKESARTLSRYSKMDEVNRRNIETAIFRSKYKNGLFGESDFNAVNEALKSNGKKLSYVGEYLSKNKDMSLDEAVKKATKRYNRRLTAEGIALTSVASAYLYGGYSAPTAVEKRVLINKYRKEHPNTRMTNAEILKKTYGR